MAYGSLPGRGFDGYIKSDDPLDIKKPGSMPLMQWPPKTPYQTVNEEKERLEKKARRKKVKPSPDKEPKKAIKEPTKPESENTDTVDKNLEADVLADLKKSNEEPQFVIKDEEEDFADYPESSTDEEQEERLKFRTKKQKITFTYLRRKRSLFRFCCPPLVRLLYSQRIQYRGAKALLSFPIGAIYGIGLYWLIVYRMGGGLYLCWLLAIFIGIGFALSTQVRCICFLSIPACCGRAGRAFVTTYVISFMITGPLANILANSRESMRVISCTASLNLNHTMERFNLMFKPVKDIVLDFVGAGDKIQKDAKQLETAFEDIEKEVKDEDEVKQAEADIEELDDEIGLESRVDVIKKKFKGRGRKKKPKFGQESEKNYGMKTEFRCEEVFTKGVRACYDSFEKAYDRCHSHLPIIGYLLCWPMKLTFICTLVSSYMGKRSCDSNIVMNPGFGASVDTAEKVQEEFEKDFSVQLQYKIEIPEETADQLVPEDVSGAIMYSFERRKRNLEFFTQFMDRLLAALCLLVFNASRKYCNKYLRMIQFDNKYVTSYFRHIDARRRKVVMNGLKLVSEVITVSILLAFDWIFYEFLDLLRRHGNVTYKQTGVHHINMTVYGDGFVGKMVRSVLKGFDQKHTADQVTTTEACLPVPTKLPESHVTRLYIVFLLLLVLIIIESYALRLRRAICSFFFLKREKQRIVFLYNDRLKKRRSYLQHMRHQVRKQAREQAIAIDSGVFLSLRKLYPKCFNCLAKLGLGRFSCLICGEKESRKLILISCPECPFSYCQECYRDTGMKCYACLPDDGTMLSDDSISDE